MSVRIKMYFTVIMRICSLFLIYTHVITIKTAFIHVGLNIIVNLKNVLHL